MHEFKFDLPKEEILTVPATFCEDDAGFSANFESGLGGASAYQIAVEHGFEGTEEEWLESLRGHPGEAGAQGPPGPAGKDGKDGQDGERGESGVYVGTDTPPDDADVWVDPNGSYSFKSETWKFTLEDETTVEKTVVLLG